MSASAEARPNLVKAAELLRAARTGARLVDLPPDAMPTNVDEAYRIQELVIGDRPVGGWKMGKRPSAAGRICCLLSSDWLMQDGERLALGAFHTPEIEVEIAFRLKTSLPAREQSYATQDVLAALGAAHIVFEVVESRFTDRRAAPKLSLLADAYSCGAVCVGGGIDQWRHLDFAGLEVRLEADGIEVSKALGDLSGEEMLEALTWLANHASQRRRGLAAGEIVLTGARIGPLPIGNARHLRAEIAEIGTVTLRTG